MVLTLTDDAGGRHRFGGRIDVAEVTEGGVAVVDYKTGAIAGAKTLKERIPLEPEAAQGKNVELQLPMYALLWAAQPGAGAATVRRVCLQRLHPDQRECKRHCVELGETGDDPTALTGADLGRFRALLVALAVEVKTRAAFGGEGPEEGCGPYLACPFVGICDEAELF
jgi:hypothetical protein